MGCDGGTFRRRIIEGISGYRWGEGTQSNEDVPRR